MGFINSLLTEEEAKKFKTLNVSFGKKRVTIDNNIVGTVYNYFDEGIKCTIDRENKRYLFYCGDDSSFARDELWSPEYFLLFCDEFIVIRIELEREKERRQQCQVLWRILDVSIENTFTHELLDINDEYIELIHDALYVYGRNGDIKNQKYNIGFVN